ncbi:DUF1236 domain-containing protein [Rhodobacteraceae bacterium 2CG4]|uniref:DUF1236 domain-containing protein n=1 Tax=Halovulum marinum TaxID=2662447 RepID=A0A6L5Z6Y7_9RHOB|nr:DUF1236 domain-containing protein [Halovulum marinum]MSU92313.1 DUF1236 domain-containing protein [Halovulum marinum]
MLKHVTYPLAAAAILAAGSAMAETQASATTDLNLRAGPGVGYPVIGVIGGQESVLVDGCLDPAQWCKVNHEGQEGWAYGAYLTAPLGGTRTPLVEAVDMLDIRTVTFVETPDVATVTVEPVGVIETPPEIVSITPVERIGTLPDDTITYVRSNPVDPIYLEGEVVVGAAIPQTVTIYDVPQSEYRYVNVNGQYVLVEPEGRRVVYIAR